MIQKKILLWPILAFLGCLPFQARGEEGSAYNPVKHFWYGVRDISETENLLILMGGSAATLLAWNFDHSLHSYFKDQNRLGVYSKIGTFYGNGIAGVSLGVGTLIYGSITSRAREKENGLSHLEALAVNIAVAETIKWSNPRRRPSGEKHSFPSGHTSTAFVTAGNLMTFYGACAGVPALMLGSLTAAARMSQNQHYLSDVVFAATLGYLMGRTYALHHLESLKNAETRAQETKLSWLILPVFENRNEFGVEAKIQF